jgi:hypothetical protein
MKYKLTDETIEHNGKTLYRIQALKDFGDVKAGDLGGYIESERNLSHDGNCWISHTARVFDNALVSHDSWVFDNAQIFDNALVSHDSWVFGNAKVFDNAKALDNTWIFGNARVHGNAQIKDGFVG